MTPITVGDILLALGANAVKAARHDDARADSLAARAEALAHELAAAQSAARAADAEVSRLRAMLDARPQEG